MVDEPLGGPFRVAEVAQRQSRPADVAAPPATQSGLGRCQRSRTWNALVGQRPPVRDAPPARRHRPDRVEDRPDRRLGRAAEADHSAPGQQLADPIGKGHRDPVPGQHGQPQRRRDRRRRSAVRRKSCSICNWAGTEFQSVTPCSAIRSAQCAGSARGVGSPASPAHRRAARTPEHVVHRQVEPEPRKAEHPVGRRRRRTLLSIASIVFLAARWVIITPLGVRWTRRCR